MRRRQRDSGHYSSEHEHDEHVNICKWKCPVWTPYKRIMGGVSENGVINTFDSTEREYGSSEIE